VPADHHGQSVLEVFSLRTGITSEEIYEGRGVRRVDTGVFARVHQALWLASKQSALPSSQRPDTIVCQCASENRY
jgi:hypothetical protein